MLKSILLIAFLVLALVTARAQEVVFYVDTVFAQANSTVVVPVKCQGFQEMAGFQFSMKWDTAHLQFDTVDMLALPNFSASNFGTTLQSEGRVSLIWYNNFSAGNVTLPDGAVVFGLHFSVMSDCAQSSVFEFSDIPTEQIAFTLDNTDLVQIPTNFMSGDLLSYCSMAIGDITVTAPPCAGDLLGSIELALEDGIPPYQIAWSNGSMGNSMNNLAAGLYAFTVTDDIGNTIVDSVLVPAGLAVSISLGTDVVSCDASVELTAASPDSFQSFQWFDANGLLATTIMPEYQITAAATEESLKQYGRTGQESPRILHLATHGFFFPDPKNRDAGRGMMDGEPVFKVSDNPMIRSGLVLSGGNHAWQHGSAPRPGMDDGILTAQEISQMNLRNTELVVLSACETGLGDIEGNEGVFGLQRAFKIAGAKYLIMSLWKVPDAETAEFMEKFYGHWLNGGLPIPDAFRQTQGEMRGRYGEVYRWGGFVLVE